MDPAGRLNAHAFNLTLLDSAPLNLWSKLEPSLNFIPVKAFSNSGLIPVKYLIIWCSPIKRSLNMSSSKDVWAQWDQAWDLGLPLEKRLVILENATAPGFVYTNMDSIISGDLERLVRLIQDVLNHQSNKLTVKHINWYEQHSQSALQWDMVDIDSGETALSGWSFGKYAEDGKLLSVSDFY